MRGGTGSLMADGARIMPVPAVPGQLLVEHEFDDLAVHGLRCTYDLDRLKQSNPL